MPDAPDKVTLVCWRRARGETSGWTKIATIIRDTAKQAKRDAYEFLQMDQWQRAEPFDYQVIAEGELPRSYETREMRPRR